LDDVKEKPKSLKQMDGRGVQTIKAHLVSGGVVEKQLDAGVDTTKDVQ
jgi:hypothetical protein